MLGHIDSWIFDLDNTLYPASAQLFAQIDVRMGGFIERLLGVDAVEARRVQKELFHSHGMTLPGLMARFPECEHAEIRPDAALSRGSVVVRTPGGGEVDASMSTRLERIATALVPGGAVSSAATSVVSDDQSEAQAEARASAEERAS